MRFLDNSFCRVFLFPILLLLLLSCSRNPAETRAKHMERGDAYFEKEEFNKAIIEYKNAIQAEPRFARGHYQLALAYLRTRQMRQAFAELQRTVDLNPENLEAQLKLGEFYLRANKTEEARQKTTLVLEKEPENIDALFLQAAVLIRENKPNEASEVLKKVTALDSKNVSAYVSLARIAGSEKRYTEAEGYLKEAIQASPDDPRTILELVRFYEQRGEWEKAERQLKQAIARDEENIALLGQLGNFYVRRGDMKVAESTFLKMADRAPEQVLPKMTLGAFYRSQKDWERALTWMNKALTLQPEKLEIQNAVASLYMDMGKPEEAQKLVDKVLKKDKGNAGARLLKARLFLEDRKPEEAAAILEAITSEYPRHGGAHYYLGIACLAKKDSTKAKSALLKALEYGPGKLRARTLLAGIYLGERAANLALEQLEIVLAKDPINYRAHVLKGNALVLKQEAKSAREAYLKATQLRPDDSRAYYQLAILERSEHRFSEAMTHVDKALALQADHLLALLAKVSLYMAQKQPAKALSFLQRTISQHKENPRLAAILHEMRGSILLSERDYEQSEAAFNKALQLSPDLTAPYLSLARLYQAKNETAKAITQYQELLEKRPQFIQAHLALAALYHGMGRTAEARKKYEKVLEINPDFAPAANNLAWLLIEQGEDPDRALNLAKKAKAQLPDDPSVADTLGLALIGKGLYASAVAELRDAVEKMPQNPTFHYHLGLAYWKNSETDQALAALHRALKSKQDFPEQQEARELLKKIERFKARDDKLEGFIESQIRDSLGVFE